MIEQMHELSAIEVENVSGGVCTCGPGAGCITMQSAALPGGTVFFVWTNCSGVPVHSDMRAP